MKMSKVANKLHPKIALNFSPTKSDKNKELNKFEATTTPPKTAKNVQVTKRTESDHHVEKLELKKSKKVNTYGGRIKASWKELMNIDGALKMVEVLDRGVQKTSKRIKIFEKPKIEKNSIAKKKNITEKKSKITEATVKLNNSEIFGEKIFLEFKFKKEKNHINMEVPSRSKILEGENWPGDLRGARGEIQSGKNILTAGKKSDRKTNFECILQSTTSKVRKTKNTPGKPLTSLKISDKKVGTLITFFDKIHSKNTR